MVSYSQNKEDLIIKEYFGDFKGTLLSVGENDGKTFSNAKLLIDNGWSAHLLEPATVFEKLSTIHKFNPKVRIYNYGLGDKEERVKFYESKNHVPGGDDLALVSSVSYEDTIKWRNSGVEFFEREIQIYPFDKFYKEAGKPKFDFITIDCESKDWDILRQLNLKNLGCKALCIEWNGDKNLLKIFTDYCKKFKFKEKHRNRENLIFCL